jgi:hypothetical protein
VPSSSRPSSSSRCSIGDDLVDRDVHLGLVLRRARDDQRRARLVDQDRVDLVDDGEAVAALRHLVEAVLHVVAQIVEAQLVVRAIGDVAGIGRTPGRIVDAGHDHAHGQPQERVDRAHPLGVAPCQIVVDRDDMDAPALQRVEVDGHGGDQRLALARLHLGDLALVQHQRADDLHIERAQAQRALGRLAHGGEGFGQQVVQPLAAGQPGAERVRLGPQAFVAQRLELGLQRVDLGHRLVRRLDLAVVGAAKDLAGDRVQSEHMAASPMAGRAVGGPADDPRRAHEPGADANGMKFPAQPLVGPVCRA